ncbi:MAG: hypothetical protein Q4D16_18335 [Eubacteriales bacterium]|nr:hypothetical protein [Eubacteriales bacterium]
MRYKEEIGNAYVNIAFDEPTLFGFLFLDGSGGYCIGGMETIYELSENNDLIKKTNFLTLP